MLDVQQLLRDAVIDAVWDEVYKEWLFRIPAILFNNIVDHLVKNEEVEDG